MVDRPLIALALICAVVSSVISYAYALTVHKDTKALVTEVIEKLDKKNASASIDIDKAGVNVCINSANRLRKMNYVLSANGKVIQTASSIADACNTEKSMTINKQN